MMTSLIVSQILSWIMILGFGVALVAIARQVGVLHIRVAPAGALTTGGGPAVARRWATPRSRSMRACWTAAR